MAHELGADALAAQRSGRAHGLDLAVEPAVGREHAHPGNLRAAHDGAVDLADQEILLRIRDDLDDRRALVVRDLGGLVVVVHRILGHQGQDR